ncbi:hypothetical protein F511_07446 [Dorcoceras hygrometricum]|uniref:Uncharacterized protein n=1 Tax=Dorcoceras hygrometricum TaxID=472368 RepID=A0A2Z7ATX4_9LAMI|nr:hypothetical protein F511_07446 [Dorcoceras hygrometricum]
MHGMDHIKSRGRSKFFTCFSPVFVDDEPGRDSESSVRKTKRVRRGVATAMKALFFKTSMAKKSRNKKDPFRSNSGYSSSSPINAKFVNIDKNPEELLLRTNSNASSIFSPSLTDSSRSSSRSSSISSNSRFGSQRIKRSASSLDFKQTSNPQAVKRDGEMCGCTVGMCIFFICLIALVLWGKVSAIVTCTSACLFFSPCRRQLPCRPEIAASSLDSYDERKRVIMEGLLERSRPRVLQR